MALDITTMTPTNILLKLSNKNQNELQNLSVQVASGYKHNDFKGYAEDATTESFLGFNAILGDTDTHIRSNNTAISRAKITSASIANLQSLANDLSALITQKRNSASGDTLPVATQTESILNKIAGELNVKFDGRYLFAGSKTNTLPVTNIQTSNLDEDNVPTANYYNGDNDVPSVRSSNSEITEYGVTANDDAFTKLIGAAHLLLAGDSQKSDDLLGQAMDMATDAISSLTTARAAVLTGIDRMTKSNATHNDFKLLIENNLSDVSQTDIVKATADMSTTQAKLQAGYMAFSILSKLRLTDYLR